MPPGHSLTPSASPWRCSISLPAMPRCPVCPPLHAPGWAPFQPPLRSRLPCLCSPTTHWPCPLLVLLVPPASAASLTPQSLCSLLNFHTCILCMFFQCGSYSTLSFFVPTGLCSLLGARAPVDSPLHPSPQPKRAWSCPREEEGHPFLPPAQGLLAPLLSPLPPSSQCSLFLYPTALLKGWSLQEQDCPQGVGGRKKLVSSLSCSVRDNLRKGFVFPAGKVGTRGRLYKGSLGIMNYVLKSQNPQGPCEGGLYLGGGGGQWQEYSKNSEQCRAFWLAA